MARTDVLDGRSGAIHRGCTDRSLKQTEQQIGKRRRDQRAVDDVENPPEPGHEPPRILHLRIAFHQALEQVPELSDPADDHSENETFPP